mmetsp:Transcript_90019/g.178983  ORF Transcript_90019/g.178983 Transcript_90019/m.178983 type:complete len:295 (+) Transcript_90019:72-956(+)|eukprot:CAMPEP_0172814418 /NCGR_PEP_ID=MMETSP1075-20121228/11223_1 /TAXON_ID=2916 /ORGANISM="Ceratium fusus, Strain PA161109" /LENGTH=294 /DNA_ID=CAMNT_0013654211 /DNA_START=32 /DNA_END=916 /DNA_ORIENTATION=+
MLATPRCSPPCSPELRAASWNNRCSSAASETDLEDLVLTDLQLANWGEALRLGVFKEAHAAARDVPEEDAEAWTDCSTGGSDPANCASGTEMVSSSGAASSASCSSESKPWLAAGHAGRLRGSVALKVTPEANEQILEGVLCRALREVLLPATGPKVSVNLSSGSSGSCSRCSREGSSHGGEEDQPIAQEIDFDFEIAVADPNDMASAREVLRLEAAFDGARRLLPTIAASALLPTGPLTVRLQLRLQEDATSATSKDELLLFSLNPHSPCNEPGMVGLECGPWQNCFSPGNMP